MIIIRKIQKKDIEQCWDIVAANFDEEAANRFDVEVSDVWSNAFRKPMYFVAVEEEGDGEAHNETVVGFAGMERSHIMHGVWTGTYVNVRKDYEGQGIGSRLMRHLLHVARHEHDAKVFQGITVAYAFLDRLGFKCVHSYGKWDLMQVEFGPLDI